MKRIHYLSALTFLGTVALASAAPIEAYSNYAGIPIGDPITPGRNVEIGDEVTLTTGPSILETIAVGYRYSAISPLGGPGTATLRVWDKSAAGTQPGNLLWESAPILLIGGGQRQGAFFENIRIAVPDRFVWTVDFNNVNQIDEAGLLYGTGATVGSGPGQSEDFLWQNLGTATAPNWQQLNEPGLIDNAWNWVSVVPEPATSALLVSGLAGCLVLRRRNAPK